MSRFLKSSLVVCVLTIGLMLPSISSAKERGYCNGPHGPINSIRDLFGTYCEAAYMARVARDFGMNVTAEQVYASKLLKVEICHFVGHDIRIQNLCVSYVP